MGKMKTVIGIGNALVDILVSLPDDNLLSEFKLEKGSMTLVDRSTMNAVLERIDALKLPIQKSAGGSVANTIYGLARLGTPSGYIGKIGDDEYGSFFKSYMERNNICATLFTGKEDTGKCIVLVSKDSERTFATYLGAAIELDASDLSMEPFRGYDYLQLEGYLVQNYPLVERTAALAKEANISISIDLASFNIVRANLDFLRSIVENYVDIVFANEEEAKVFTGKDDPYAALVEIAGKCKTAVVKIGKEGSWIKEGTFESRISPISARSIDTTGAGDLYASGFFYGLTSGQRLDVCGKIGSIVSGKVIEVFGSKMDDARWHEVTQMIGAIV